MSVSSSSKVVGHGEHVLLPRTLRSPHSCAICSKFIWGVARQALECHHCKLLVHHKCSDGDLSLLPCSRSSEKGPEGLENSSSSSRCAKFKAVKADTSRSPAHIEIDEDYLRIHARTLKKGTRIYNFPMGSLEICRGLKPEQLQLQTGELRQAYNFGSAEEANKFLEAVELTRGSSPLIDLASPVSRQSSSSSSQNLTSSYDVLEVVEKRHADQVAKLEPAHSKALAEDMALLKELYSRGVVDDLEYQRRANAAVRKYVAKQEKPPGSKEQFELTGDVREEMVTKQWYSWAEKKWEVETIKIRMETADFAEGKCRKAYRMVDESQPEGSRCYVAKIWNEEFKDDDLEGYYIDVEMQCACAELARAFNSRTPPKLVEFVEAYVMKRDRPDLPPHQRVAGVEPYLPGRYTKYNNNVGYVSFDDRNTPQAFSHFTFEYTDKKLMVVDLQGVGDVYTDPQVHTQDRRGFGVGNRGQEGIQAFFKTHKCNSICKYLGLSPQGKEPTKDGGTEVTPGRRRTRGTTKFRVSDYVKSFKPVPESATEEDLAMLGISMVNYNTLAEHFNKFCSEEQVEIDMSSILPLLEGLKGNITKENMNDILKHMDMDGNGVISFTEFLLWWTGHE